jgi:hypothetical protein
LPVAGADPNDALSSRSALPGLASMRQRDSSTLPAVFPGRRLVEGLPGQEVLLHRWITVDGNVSAAPVAVPDRSYDLRLAGWAVVIRSATSWRR